MSSFRSTRSNPAAARCAAWRVLRWLLAGWLGLALALGAAAQPAGGSADADIEGTLASVRRQLDAAQLALRNPSATDDAELLQLRGQAVAAQARTADTAQALAPQLALIEARLAELGALPAGSRESPDIAAQRNALTKARDTLTAQVKLARLLSLESDQLVSQILTARRGRFQARLGERAPSILAGAFWRELLDDLPRDVRRLAGLRDELAGALRSAPLGAWLALPLLPAAVGGALGWSHRRSMRWLTTRAPSGRLRRSLRALSVLVVWTGGFAALGAGVHGVFDAGALRPETSALVDGFATLLAFCGFLPGLGQALICASRPSWRLPPLPDAVAEALRWLPARLTLMVFVTASAERLSASIDASLSTTVAVNCGVALALGLTLGLTLMRAERVWRFELARAEKPQPMWLAIVASFSWLLLGGALVCLLAGYVAFGSFALKQIVWVSAVSGTAYLLTALIDDLLMGWLGSRARGHDAPPSTTPASKTPAQAAVLLSAVLRIAVLLLALSLLLAPFGEGPSDLLRRSGRFQEGVSIGEVRLQPAAVLQAVLVLVLGLVGVRLLRRWLTDRWLPTTSLDAGMRSSATALFGYAGVVFAVALAMSALGIGLERIAWVASALSVGIGFGLQAVVQNFVSGLILLAERPVKVGDWVSLGGVEGDIRRINVRATEIQMGDRSTVIVPNSEFITKVVRNVTLADPLGLVQLKLPVPLGTDAQQVRDLVLAAFAANTDVIDEPAPNVLLDGVDGGYLLFNATGFVASPRMTGGVRSALLFDVLARLQEAGIALAKPPTLLVQTPPAAAGPVAATPGPAGPST